MPAPRSSLDRSRVDFDETLRAEELPELVQRAELKTLQCVEPVPERVWRLLDEDFFSQRPDVELRVYGHYGIECDLGFARTLKHVRRFAADCLMRAMGVEAIAAIPRLESLSLGVYALEDFRVLDSVSEGLVSLSLGATTSKKPSLESLPRLRSLKRLYLEGQQKQLEVLAELHELEELTLRSIAIEDLHFLAALPKLWSLDIKLGGVRSFAGIEGKASIRYLELWQIRGVERADIVAELPGLQRLFLQSLPRIESLPDLERSTSLRRVVLQNLKGLHDLSALERAPALLEFGLIQGGRQSPEELLPVLRNPRLQRVSAFFGSTRKNEQFSKLREQHGKSDWKDWDEFEYR